MLALNCGEERMNIPIIAKTTFDNLRNQPAFLAISQFIVSQMKAIPYAKVRALFIHKAIDEFNEEIFAHPIVKEFMPCKAGCSACCHTQVSVTQDEALLLLDKIRSGVAIDEAQLNLQAQSGNNSEAYYKLSFQDRKCVFLNEKGECRVYEDRPSVCRTNAVLGSADQCNTSNSQQSLRLIRTEKADMVIAAAFAFSEENGTLPYMIYKLLRQHKRVSKENTLV